MATTYLRSGALGLVVVILLAGALNVLVDPYRLYCLLEIPGLNELKPRAQQRAALTKAFGIASVRPTNLVFGNSRAEMGFDPNSPYWPSPGPTYNAAIEGASVDAALRGLQDALTVSQVRHVVIGLDFIDFLAPADGPPPAAPIELQPNTLLSVATQVADLVSTVISIEALWDSALTIAYQRDPLLARDSTALGFDPVREGDARARKMGYSGVFKQRAEVTAREFSQWPRSIPVISASWGQLQAILWLCESRGVQAHLVIYPYHAQFLQLIKVDGRWPLYEQWKRTLVNVAERAREGNEKLTLWDFSGYHRYSTETIPKDEDNRIVMKWYWEAGHFKRELGERILHRVFGGGDPHFGVQLTTANIQQQLDAIKAAQLDYEKANPAELEQLRALTRRMRRTSETEQATDATADVASTRAAWPTQLSFCQLTLPVDPQCR